jgi:hypothetical protein
MALGKKSYPDGTETERAALVTSVEIVARPALKKILYGVGLLQCTKSKDLKFSVTTL